MTQVHQAIAHEKTWLNVSRPLTADDTPVIHEKATLKQKSEPVDLRARKPIVVKLILQPGWGINKSAPSWLALFHKAAGGFVLVKEFHREELEKRRVELPELHDSGIYRLQGTLYFCKEGKGALCSIQSVDREIHAISSAGGSVIEIGLN